MQRMSTGSMSLIVSCCSNYNIFSNLKADQNIYTISERTGYWLPFLIKKSKYCFSFLGLKRKWHTRNFLSVRYHITKCKCKVQVLHLKNILPCRLANSSNPQLWLLFYCTFGSYSFNGSQCFKCPFGTTTLEPSHHPQ